MNITAWVVTQDDRLLFEIELPQFQYEICFVHSRLSKAGPVREGDPPAVEVATEHRASCDRLESVAQQLANEDPNLWVYRVEPFDTNT